MNKKYLLIIIAASILALFAAFLILKLSQKPKLINDNLHPKVQNVQLKNEYVEVSVKNEKEKTEAKKVSQPPKTDFINKTNNLKTKTTTNTNTNTNTNTVQTKESAVLQNEIQEVRLENTLKEKVESGVEIPVNFISKNTYKYIYTPAKYPKSK